MNTLAKKIENVSEIPTIYDTNFIHYYYTEIGKGYEISIITGGYQANDGLMEVALYKDNNLLMNYIIDKITAENLNDLIETSRERPNMAEQLFELEKNK